MSRVICTLLIGIEQKSMLRTALFRASNSAGRCQTYDSHFPGCALHRVPVSQREDGSDTVWSGTTWQGFPGCLMCLSPLCCSNWQWDITHRRIDLTRMLPPLSPVTPCMRITCAPIRLPGSSSQRFCPATKYACLRLLHARPYPR